MIGFVVDASVALAWCFGDEATPATGALLDRLEAESAAAPALLPLEVANVLVLAHRHGRISAAQLAESVALVEKLPIWTDPETSRRALGTVLDLARAEGLGSYDACYLELALRLGVALATRDRALRAAAERRGVALLGE